MLDSALASFKSQSIFPKILLVFLFVITPLCVMSLIINAKGEASVKREIDKSLGARTAYFSDLLEVEINRMMKHQKAFIFDHDLQRMVYLENTLNTYEWGETTLRVQEKMQIIQTSSTYIKNVTAHMLLTGKSIASDNPIASADDGAVEAFVKQARTTGSPLLYYKDRLLLGSLYPDTLLSDQRPDYVVFIELSVPELRKALMAFTENYDDAGAVLVDMDEGWSITNDPRRKILEAQIPAMPASGENGEQPAIKSYRTDGVFYLLSYKYLQGLQMALMVYVPEKQVLGDLDAYRDWFWALSLCAMLVICIFAAWIYRLIHKPLTKLVFSFRKVEDGYLEPMPLPKGRDEFRYLFEHFNAMVTKLKDLIHRLYEQDLRAKNSELKQLQSQINPHFLYNTYFVLHRLAKLNDIDGVVQFSHYLGQYFQFITRSGASEIPLEQEMHHARLYVDIQQIRFSNRIDVEIDELPESCRQVCVPKLIVQPIIENAYKYGMERKRGDGLIVIKHAFGDAIRISIEDNGPGMEETALRKLQAGLRSSMEGEEITGIRNVHRRLQLQFGKGSGIVVGPSKHGGLRVEIVILRPRSEPRG